MFKFDLKISSKIRKIKYVIDVKNDELVVYGICPVHADEKDEEMMAQMSEFLHRANYGLKNGCFEFDYEDGEIGFRSYIDCDGRLPSAENVKTAFIVRLPCLNNMEMGLRPLFLPITWRRKQLQCVRSRWKSSFQMMNWMRRNWERRSHVW